MRTKNETHRPQFHFTAEKNWLNDPNGLMFYEGEYHLFFQHNPTGINWGNMTWGHAVSTDLVHWKQLPNAIEPDELGTIFSGSGVVDHENTTDFQTADEKPMICIYTSAGEHAPQKVPFTQSIAYSNDRGRTWIKYENNPVLDHIVGHNRDPKVIWHKPTQKWIMALYLDGNDFALFRSGNLKSWERICDVHLEGASECPDLFELPIDGDPKNRKWVFWGGNGRHLIGTFDGENFVTESDIFQTMAGHNSYAAQTFSDLPETDGRRIQIAWMRGGKYPEMPFNQQMSFPNELTLRSTIDGVRLFTKPIREIELLHKNSHTWENIDGDRFEIRLSGDLFDIRAKIGVSNDSKFDINICNQIIEYDFDQQMLISQNRSSAESLEHYGIDPRDEPSTNTIVKLPPINGEIELQILADRTSIEIFGNDGAVAISNCFFSHPDDRKLEITAENFDIRSLEIYELKSAWEND